MNQLQSQFLTKVVLPAQQSMRATGIPASITIAQAILESSNKNGWGQSSLARLANNYFGIKADAHATPNHYIEFKTEEDGPDGRKSFEMARFARYPSPIESFAAHARLIAGGKRYQPAMAVCADPAKFADALQGCGYSTATDAQGHPDYARRLMLLVNEYDLTQYDLPPDQPAAAKEKAA